jgi:tRNA pseudouridine55 synthase
MRRQTDSGTNAINGILVVDKPVGVTSAEVVSRVKRRLGVSKVGHAGTLDPGAEGVLICCINQATKLARFLLRGSKTYRAVLKLGIETDTQDAYGQVMAIAVPTGYSEKTIRETLAQFEGTIRQTPPVYSALKHRGQRLYKLARRGKPVQKPARKVKISAIRLIDFNLPLVRFEVSCSSGTYIRTLCADIGRSLGCGGHMAALKRLESSGFSLREAVRLSELESLLQGGRLAARIIPMADALPKMQTVCADERLARAVRHGRPIRRRDLETELRPEGNESDRLHVKIVDTGGRLLAVLRMQPDNPRLDYCFVINRQRQRMGSRSMRSE